MTLCETGTALYKEHATLLVLSIQLTITGSNGEVDKLTDKAWEKYREHREHCKICGKMEQDEHPY